MRNNVELEGAKELAAAMNLQTLDVFSY